ncbi:ABC transporter ATP-binding protein [Tabrizicola sp.]|uniref:ABC transporter ATP-binding protein n=1 Tax=Tabrizicola sp. TaxID=2005166 RepID=UPI002606833B|nr:ABC transporter ATP-binding protein [Tabrizicola sp.]MDM7930511.1 ABC transporter ATP-binding protein [Tabrizicola sp.]
MASLEISALTKSFDGQEVLRGLDLSVGDGEFWALVGPSGCGKSVLLRNIAGLVTPDSGTIRLAGRDVTRLAPAERDIAMVFQSYALYPHLSVAGNLGIGLRQAGLSRADTAEAVRHVADLLGLGPLMNRLPQELSGGERQRVAIGRAIVRKPSLFLFDEPLSNLDAALRVHMRIEMADLHRRLGRTTIYVTHDQVEAMTLADRIVVMNAGRIEQTGRPMDVYHDPANMFVAGFIGSPRMNFLDAGRLGRPGRHVGIRPEHITVSRVSGAVSGTVDHIETLGSETNLLVRTAELGFVTVRLFGHQEFAANETVHLDFDRQRELYFDAAGQRLR